MRITHFAKHAVVLLAVAVAAACSGQQEQAPPAAATTAAPTPAAATTPDADAPIPATTSPYDAMPEGVRAVMDKPFTGDFDAMVKRRVIRVAVTFNRTHYFIDKGQERGVTYEALKSFENDLNADLKTGNLKVHVAMISDVARSALRRPDERQGRHGRGHGDRDPGAGEARRLLEPTRTNVNEVVVTGPGAPPITTVDDLAGQEVFVRKGSIYDESLVRLNAELKTQGQTARGDHRRPGRPRGR